jgi:hypothetical protein
MKKTMCFLLVLVPTYLFAQIGVKGGLNFCNVTNASSINSSSQSGFHVGLLLAPPSKGIISSRTELIFSRQGYNYKTGTKTGDVNLDYIQMGQMMSINITKFFSLLLGAQTAYLISAQADSTNNGTGATGTAADIMSLYNRIDYGFALGAEAHPVLGLIVGLRYNISLAKLYQDLGSMQPPSFTAEDAKNNVVQLYVGWRFGKQPKKEKK